MACQVGGIRILTSWVGLGFTVEFIIGTRGSHQGVGFKVSLAFDLCRKSCKVPRNKAGSETVEMSPCASCMPCQAVCGHEVDRLLACKGLLRA